MLSENIKTIFGLLSCSNSEIARAAGCSRSYISHIINDERNLKPEGRAIARLAGGIYSFADEENMLEVLCKLTGTDDDSREVLLPALIAWLFGTDRARLPKEAIPVKRRKENDKSAKQQEFGDKLDAVMNILELSNARLSHMINVDDSLVSRWRRGLRSPHDNKQLADILVKALLRRSGSISCENQLAKLSGIPETILFEEQGIAMFTTWLFGEEDDSIVTMLDHFLELITSQTEMNNVAAEETAFKLKATKLSRYWNVEGLRQAVIRFLLNVSKNGGEIWLYSDESMEWLSGDAAFFAGWKTLMAACIKHGVSIKIIHNIDRNIDEMLTAIAGWIPLYMSGQIEPYVCAKPADRRFTHTLFLNPDNECIYGAGVNGDTGIWYDYITDTKRLDALKMEFEALLSFSEPLMRVYVGKEQCANFRNRLVGEKRNINSILPGLSLATLPEEVLNEMLKRSDLDRETKREIARVAKKRRSELRLCLSGPVCEMVTLPDDEELFSGRVPLNLSIELLDVKLFYTEAEYAAHIRAVLDLMKAEKNYQLQILPELPFPDIQIVLSDISVSAVRSTAPCLAFTFTDIYMVHAFGEYFNSLKARCYMEKSAVSKVLKRYID